MTEPNGEIEQAQVERLNQVFDTSSEKNRNALLSFLAAQLYVLVIVGGTTDIHLLQSSTAFNLPMVNLGIPIVGFYIFAPLLLLVFHFNLLFNLAEHVDLLKKWQQHGQNSQSRFPYMINIIAFYQYKREQDDVMNLFKLNIIKGVAVFAMIVFPIFVLLLTLIWFLDYHSIWVSSFHAMLVLTDLYVMRNYISHLSLPIFKQSRQWLAKICWLLVVSAVALCMTLLIGVLTTPGKFADMCADPTRFWCSHSNLLPLFAPVIDIGEQSIAQIKPQFKNTHSLSVENSTEKIWSLYQSVDLKDRHLALANFAGATLYGADFRGANLQHANLAQAKLQGANFLGAQLERVFLTNAQLQHANMTSANLQHSYMTKVNLSEADLTRANMVNAKLTNADLSNANLSWVTLQRADLTNANLYRVRLYGATLNGAKFSGAKLIKAQLLGVEVYLTQFDGANFNGADLTALNLNKATFDGAKLDYATLQGVTIKGGSYTGVSLRQTSLQGAVIDDADFSFCLLKGTRIYGLETNNDALFSRCAAVGEPEPSLDIAHQYKDTDYSKEGVWEGLRQVLIQALGEQKAEHGLKLLDEAKQRAVAYLNNPQMMALQGRIMVAHNRYTNAENLNQFKAGRRLLACQNKWIARRFHCESQERGELWSDAHFAREVLHNGNCGVWFFAAKIKSYQGCYDR